MDMRKKLVLLFGFLVLFALLAGLVVYELNTIQGLARIHVVDIPEPKNNMNYTLDNYEDKWMKGKHIAKISGWAFINNVSSEGQKLFLVLKSSNNQYIFDTQKRYRPDVTKAFKDNNGSKDDSGFYAIFDIDNLEDACFRIGIFIENYNQSDIQWTDVYLNKESEVISFGDFVSHSFDLVDIDNINNVVWMNIDNIGANSDFLDLRGWAFIQNIATLDMRTFILLKDDTGNISVFDTLQEERKDVTDVYRDHKTNYNQSGFKARIDKAKLKKVKYQIGMLIKKSDLQGINWTDTYIDIN